MTINLIAEIGINHDGEINKAIELINHSHKSGANAIKFQYRNLKRCYSESAREEIGDQMIKSEILRNFLNPDQIIKLLIFAKKLDLKVGISFFNHEDINDFKNISDFDFFKVPSVELLNFKLINKLLSFNKEVLISTGCSTENEIIKCIEKIKNFKNWKMLHCISNYPLNLQNSKLGFITRLKKSYSMVIKNSINFLKQRNEINPKLKFGLNFIVIPENIDQVLKILNLVGEINNNVTNGRGVDFITLRDDFQSATGHEENAEEEKKKYKLHSKMDDRLREKLFNVLNEFKKIREKNFPDLHIDYGYSIFAVSRGVVSQGLNMIESERLPDYGYPQLSLAIDLYGDVFLYREAGFLERFGNKKFIIGRLNEKNNLEEIIENFLNNSSPIQYEKSDTKFMDSFDHVLGSIINQAKEDKDVQIPFDKGPILARSNLTKLNLGNNWYTDELI